MGHEFVGTVVTLGSSYVTEDRKERPGLYSSLAIGDRVISPFTVSCAECSFVYEFCGDIDVEMTSILLGSVGPD